MKDRLCDVMYNMFLKDTLPDLDMEDFQVMWEALMNKWDIKIGEESWNSFIKEINCTASDRYSWFKQTFNRYFYES